MKLAWFLVALAACGSGNHAATDARVDAASDGALPDAVRVVPAFRNPVVLPDDQLATQAMAILGATGAPQTSCNNCHGITRQHLRYWRALGDTAMTTCLTDLAVTTQASARQMIDCLRTMPELSTSAFAPQNLGIYATAARLDWFDYVFWKAYGAEAATEKSNFLAMAAMPHGDVVPSLTQAQFDIIAEWTVRGQPLLDNLLPQDNAPTECTAGISAEVASHTAALKMTGWRAINRDSAMAMFDCGTATDPKQCLTHQPLINDQPFATGWAVAGAGSLRLLDTVTYQSSYWTRSSPDGRFIGHGVRNTHTSNITDLERAATHISVAALYDPGFFPDGSGFVFQGGSANTCPISVLTANPTAISMTEAGCAQTDEIGLYQHVGKGLDGGDYFTIDSQFVSDDGGHQATLKDPNAFFSAQAKAYFNPFVLTNNTYVHGTQVSINQAYEGDSVLSPSATLELTRVSGPGSKQIGYVLHKVTATLVNSTYHVDAPEIARYCLSGGKPGFSYDERWVVYHHYITAADAVALGFTSSSDPAFAPYLQLGAANLYLMDLATGVPRRITNMQPGQYALMPHFRSDGWIYADVRDDNAAKEYFIASDAALQAE
jgi:hypothetical protein